MTIKALLATLIGTSVSAAPATPKLELFVKDYPCDAGTCTGDGTCCSGHAAPCCPYVSGQCCASTDSCCPSGTNCYYNPATGKDTCMAGNTAVRAPRPERASTPWPPCGRVALAVACGLVLGLALSLAQAGSMALA